MNTYKELPLTVRRSIEIVGLCALGAAIILGKTLVMPLLVALIIAILLLPLVRWFNRRKIPELFSIILAIVCLIILISAIGLLLSVQIATLVSDIATIKKNLILHWNNLTKWVSGTFHYSTAQQTEMLNMQLDAATNNVSSFVKGAFSSLGDIVIFFGLLPIYIFFILFYRRIFYQFVLMWYKVDRHDQVHDTLKDVEVIVKYYLGGLLIQIGYLTILVGGGLLLLGIPHAVLIGITFALLNLIPYLGPLIGNLIGVLLTLTSSQDIRSVFTVLIVIAVVQFFDNNIIMPRIIGSKVKINALGSIVGIVAGGLIAGIPGMFVSIPVMAILKIVFDRSDNLRPWGVLLGEDDEKTATLQPFSFLTKLVKKKKKQADDQISGEMDRKR